MNEKVLNAIHKKTSTTRTYHVRAFMTAGLHSKLFHAFTVNQAYFNYGLKYLYQHYGFKKLDVYLPDTPKGKQRLVKLMKQFAQSRMKQKGYDLKVFRYNIQSVDKMYEQLIVNFGEYRKKQRSIKNWSNAEKKKYLRKHNCKLQGYGRIDYKHDPSDFRSVTVKDNGGRIQIINNHYIKLPYFGKIQTKESLCKFRHEKITEARLFIHGDGSMELQIIVAKHFVKSGLTKQNVIDGQSLDVNSKNNEFFKLLTVDKPISWPKEVEQKYKAYDKRSRELQKYLKAKQHKTDNSRKSRRIKKALARCQAKCAFMIDHWQLMQAKEFCEKYPVMFMEELHAFGMRISKRAKNKRMRKNTNHKLATIQPSTFRKMMEYIYEDNGHLLVEVNTIDTSKRCFNCGYVYHDLKPGQKEWMCPFCLEQHDRDYNATQNIKFLALHPLQHPAVLDVKRFPYLNEDNVVTVF